MILRRDPEREETGRTLRTAFGTPRQMIAVVPFGSPGLISACLCGTDAYVVEHSRSESAGEHVLLARVITTDQPTSRGQVDGRPVTELRFGAGR